MKTRSQSPFYLGFYHDERRERSRMALVDPYMPCPCGSGQKFKWCCQKVETYAERAQRMAESGQIESSLKPLEEGLARFPGNPWLLIRKALAEVELKRLDNAKATLATLLSHDAGHLGAYALRTRLVLETQGPVAAVGWFHQGLSAIVPEHRRDLAALTHYLGVALAEAHHPIAARRHLELAAAWAGDSDRDRVIERALGQLRANPRISAWEKNPYRLLPAPAGATDAFRESFERAIGWAEEGLWSASASAFELLSAGSTAGAVADHNRGLCCLWMAEEKSGVAALRRYVARVGATTEAVDLEALCQILDPGSTGGETVEFVQLSWPLRDRNGLLRALAANPYCAAGSERPIDPDAEESRPTESFLLLDRPRVEARPGLTRAEIPIVEGEVIVGDDSVVLETHDDSRMDRLVDRFTAAARGMIPPAHPRTRVIGKTSRYLLALNRRWSLPEGLDEAEAIRLVREQGAYLLGEVWPETPNPVLRRRTPTQAAKAGDAEVPLRAAIRLLEVEAEDTESAVDWGSLRSRLNLPPEPAVEAASLDLNRLHLSRWSMIPVAELDDNRLVNLYLSARGWGLARIANKAGRVIADRPSVVARFRIDPLGLFGSLAIADARRGDAESARELLRRGRQAESVKPTPRNFEWEMIELQTSTLVDPPETWVRSIIVLFERYRGNQDATTALLYRLAQLGIVQMANDPRKPDRILLDTSILDQLVATYGPRVTTATGELGAATGSGEIWAPESARGGAAIWTPGSQAPAAAAPGQERPRLILPGQ